MRNAVVVRRIISIQIVTELSYRGLGEKRSLNRESTVTATQQHFGRPGNKFWKALYLVGFTPRLFHPSEQSSLLPLGLGITNLVARATTAQSDVSSEEFRNGSQIILSKVKEYKPKWIAFVGISAYKTAFGLKDISVGKQDKKINTTSIWVLPSTSGLNAQFTLDKTVALFKLLKDEVAKHS